MVKKCPKGSKIKSGRCVKSKKRSSSKIESTGMKIFLGVALALIFFGLFNLGVETFYDGPEYNDYCDGDRGIPGKIDWTEQECTTEGGVWQDGFCNFYSECRTEYDKARDSYSNNVFYIFVIVGLVLAVVGLFIVSLPFQIVGIGAGTALIIEGILRNLENKIPAFIAGILAFGILSYFVWRKFR